LSGKPGIIGATWLDQQLIGGGKGLRDQALAARSRTHYGGAPISWPNRGWQSIADNVSSLRETCWRPYVDTNWLKLPKILRPKPAWDIGLWPMGSV